jgi:anaerobic magnesium-protoporphyrin IX monomethyl ester cyclase
LLAATVRHLPLDIQIFDGYVTRQTFRAYKALLASADYLAITVMSPMKALDTEVTIRLAKRLRPGLRVIVGGNHASAFPERWLEHGADYVIVREGERSFPELMTRLLAGETEPAGLDGVAFRGQSGALVRTVDQESLPDLDQSPMPAWDMFDLRPYDLGTGGRGLTATVEISRGCPHRCDFCNINKYWSYRQRYKSLPRVLEELDRLHRLGVRKVMFADDNFGGRHGFTSQLFEEMIRRGYGFELGAFIRGDTIYRDPAFAALAARAGLRLALVGIEALNPAWLRDHQKGVRAGDPVQMYRQVYQTLKSNQVFLLGLFINSTDPDGPIDQSGRGADGKVCDFHYSADLLPQKNSALYDNLVSDPAVSLKDMFYHDWNTPSVQQNGRLQKNRKTVRAMLHSLDVRTLTSLWSSQRMLRRYWWRHLALAGERSLCMTLDDLRRYRWAKDETLSPQARQERMIESVLSERTLAKLERARVWRSPLGLRNGLWSARRFVPTPRALTVEEEALHAQASQVREGKANRARHADQTGEAQRDKPRAERRAVANLVRLRVR